MILKVFDIPEDGMELKVSAGEKAGAWFRDVVIEAFPEDYPQDARATLDLSILRTADNVQVSGTAEIALKPSCARCSEPFERTLTVPVQVNLAPRQGMDVDGPESDEGLEDGLDGTDVAFSFYKGEQIDASEMIREVLMLAVPIRYLCEESCKGLCAGCGKNLNQGACACPKKAVDPRLAVLGTLLKH